MLNHFRRSQAALLDGYWNALIRGRAERPAGIDPEQARFTEQLVEASARLDAEAGFAATLRSRLEAQATGTIESNRREWAGPAVGPNSHRPASSSAIKEHEEQTIVNASTDTPHQPIPIQQRRWARETIKIAVAAIVFGAIGAILVLLLRSSGTRDHSLVPGGLTTPTTFATATVNSDATRQAARAALTATVDTARAATATVNAASGVPGEIVDTVPVGESPWAIAATDDAIWVTNTGDGTVSRIDPATRTVVATITIGNNVGEQGSPQFVATYNGQVWVTNDADKSLVRIDPATNQIVQTIPLPGAFDPWGLLVDASGIWVSSSWLQDDQRVVHLDPADGTLLGTIPISEPFSMASGFGSIWINEHGQRQVVRVDPATNGVLARIPVEGLPAPLYIAAGPDSIWISQQNLGSVARIDPTTNTVVATIDTGMANTGAGIRVTSSGVWVDDEIHGGLVRIDPNTNQVSGIMDQASGGPVAILEIDSAIWVVHQYANEVVRIVPTP